MTLFGWTPYDVLQTLIIAVVVMMSVLHVARKLAPNWVYGGQSALANLLEQASRPTLVRRLGNFLQPSMAPGGGCDSGCNTCASCESNPERDAEKNTERNIETKPLKFTRHI